MVPIANKPMIDYNLELLRNAKVKWEKIVIITKYLHKEIRDYFNSIEHFDDLEIILPKVNPLDTADAVRKAANYIDTENFIVSMADIITNLPLNDFMSFHHEKGGIASITLKDVPHPRSYGVIMLNQDSRILLFLEKPHPEELSLATLTFSLKETIRLQSNLVNTGIYAFKKKVLDILDRVHDLMDFGKHVFPYLAREHGIFGYARRDYYWIDAGNPQTYLYTNWDVLRRWSFPYFPKATCEENDIWFDCDKPIINLEAKINGPAVIGKNVQVEENVHINPKTAIGDNVTIGKNSIVVNSVLWDDAQVGENCQVQRCLVDYHAVVRNNSTVEEESILFHPRGLLRRSANMVFKSAKNNTLRLRSALRRQLDAINQKLSNCLQMRVNRIIPLLACSLVLIGFIWSYWPGLMDLWSVWQRSDEYSSGLLVPFLAVYILWSRRHDIAQCHIKPSLWGLFAFLVAQGLRFLGLFFMYGSAERLSIVLSIAALVLLLFGWQFFRKVATVLLFLCLMLPWPNRVQAAVALPLQRWATSSSVFCLEMLGYPVVQEGNIIHIGRATVAVAEACNGLRMITAFFIISGLVAFLVKRAWWEKLIILASSLPIALLCNSVRLTITAVAFTVLNGEYWERIFHNFGGYAMMPLALAAVVTELWLLTTLTTLPMKKEAIIIERQKR